MQIYKHLKLLRQKNKKTLQQLSDKIGYGTGNLSSYETGKLQAKDNTLLKILTKGFDMTENKALSLIGKWRQEELEDKYNLSLSQNTTSYNYLDNYLKQEGLNTEEIKEIKNKINFYKKRKKEF